MGNYAGTDKALVLEMGRQTEVWANEVVGTGGAVAMATSRAVRLNRTRGVYYPQGFSVELAFASNPGTFEVDILVADTDDLTRYISKGKITQADLNINFVGRAEFTDTWCLFVALQMVSLTNAVPVTGLITR